MKFHAKLLELRTAAGMTQDALAAAAGIPVSTVRKYEHGNTAERLNFSFVVKLAKALGTDCTAFAGCEDVAAPAEEEQPARKKGKR